MQVHLDELDGLGLGHLSGYPNDSTASCLRKNLLKGKPELVECCKDSSTDESPGHFFWLSEVSREATGIASQQ
jgi:hypothetical protein